MWKHFRVGKLKAHWRKSVSRLGGLSMSQGHDLCVGQKWARDQPPLLKPSGTTRLVSTLTGTGVPSPRDVLLSPLAGTVWHRAREQLSSADGPSPGDLSSLCYRRSEYVGHAGHPWVTAKPPSPLSQMSRRQAEHSTWCPQEAASWGTSVFPVPTEWPPGVAWLEIKPT